MSLVIRDARRADAALIHGFILELAAYEKLAHEVEATPSDIAERLFCPSPKAFALIAELDGAPCGFALYFYNFSTFRGRHGVYLEDLFVRDASRGRGAGKALLARLARIALDAGCARLEWQVLDWNAPSIAFYKALGARAMDEWTVYRVSDGPLAALAAADS
ncbi:MAG: GNAT family N-acetyltransferase [Parvularculaceae bacterium]|nr:GNAT family N-acetyltransferase [Parvularculaceae bacterium]